MNKSARSLVYCSIAASGMLVLSGCGKHDASTEAPPAASTAAAPATPTPMTPAAPGTTAMPPASTMSAPAPSGSAMPAPASTSASVATPPAEQPFAVSKVVVGDSVNAAHKVSTARDSIAASEKDIYASVETSGKTAGATLSARWSYLEGKGQLVTAISQSIATEGPAVTTFKIQNPHNWPAGKYKVDISLDGKPVSTQAFEVKAPS